MNADYEPPRLFIATCPRGHQWETIKSLDKIVPELPACACGMMYCKLTLASLSAEIDYILMKSKIRPESEGQNG